MKENKAKIVSIGVILLLLAVSFFMMIGKEKTDQKLWAVINVAGEDILKYNLSKDWKKTEVDLNPYGEDVHLTLEGHSIYFTQSDCADKVCINAGRLSKLGDIAVCLPNRVIASVMSETQATGKSGGYTELYSNYFIDTFDTAIQMAGYTDSMEDFDRYFYYAHERFKQLSHYYDRFYEYSGINNISTINKNAGIAPVKVDDILFDLIKFSIEVNDTTKGKVNVAMGPVLEIWHGYISKYKGMSENTEVPSIENLQLASLNCDINNIVLDEENNTVFLKEKGMIIDVGAIAKGYAAQIVADEIYQMGLKSFYISAGGNIVVKDPPPGKEYWDVGVQDPDSKKLDTYVDEIDEVQVKGQSVVTSGDYQRFYFYNGQRIHHIIDSNTLQPAMLYRSVSVIADDSGFCDASSTALFCMDLELGKEYAKQNNLRVIWIMQDGTIIKSFE